jgi:hypothetical protein
MSQGKKIPHHTSLPLPGPGQGLAGRCCRQVPLGSALWDPIGSHQIQVTESPAQVNVQWQRETRSMEVLFSPNNAYWYLPPMPGAEI